MRVPSQAVGPGHAPVPPHCPSGATVPVSTGLAPSHISVPILSHTRVPHTRPHPRLCHHPLIRPLPWLLSVLPATSSVTHPPCPQPCCCLHPHHIWSPSLATPWSTSPVVALSPSPGMLSPTQGCCPRPGRVPVPCFPATTWPQSPPWPDALAAVWPVPIPSSASLSAQAAEPSSAGPNPGEKGSSRRQLGMGSAVGLQTLRAHGGQRPEVGFWGWGQLLCGSWWWMGTQRGHQDMHPPAPPPSAAAPAWSPRVTSPTAVAFPLLRGCPLLSVPAKAMVAGAGEGLGGQSL